MPLTLFNRFLGVNCDKWDKEIVRYAEKHDDAYSTFFQFSTMIQSEAKKRNHPNVSTGVATTNIVKRHREESKGNPPSKPRPEIGRILKTVAAPVSSGVPTKETTMSLKRKHCILHNMPGHDISEWRAFESMMVRERDEDLPRETVLLNHTASACIRRVSSAVSVELSETQTSYI